MRGITDAFLSLPEKCLCIVHEHQYKTFGCWLLAVVLFLISPKIFTEVLGFNCEHLKHMEK